MTESSDRAPLQLWSIVLWLVLTSLSLLLIAELVRSTPCWTAALATPLLSYPLWLSTRESFLFSRRAIVKGATPEGCLTRHLLLKGQIGAILLILPALAMGALLLAFALRLNAPQWTLLIADALLLALLHGFVQRRFASQIHPDMLGAFVRGWPLRWFNLGVLALAFFVLSFFIQGAPDLRQESWQAAAEHAFHDGRNMIACPWIGWLVGGLDGLEHGAWALAQRYIPALPHPEWRLAAWLLLLAQVGALALFFTRLLLGVLTLVEQRAIRAESVTGESALGKTFVLTILVLALFPIYAALQLRDLDSSDFQSPAPAVLNWIDPCRARASENQALASELNATIQARTAEINREIAPRVARELDLLFAPVESAVDDYLDWYFTVAGEYERLVALVAGDYAQRMSEELKSHLFEATDFDARLNAIDAALREDTLRQIADVSQGAHDDLKARIGDTPCAPATLNITHMGKLERDVWRASAAGTTGATVGTVTAALISKKVVASVVAKVAAKKSVQAAVAALAKVAAKKGGGALAGAAGGAAVSVALCAPGGPAAVVCGVVGGVVTGVAAWLTVDKIAIEIDEAVSRDAMRAEILAVLAEEKVALQTTLIERSGALVSALANDIQTTADGVFIPARDGL